MLYILYIHRLDTVTHIKYVLYSRDMSQTKTNLARLPVVNLPTNSTRLKNELAIKGEKKKPSMKFEPSP